MIYLPYILLAVILGLTYLVVYLFYALSKDKKLLNRPQEDYGESLEVIEGAQKQANAIVERAVESAKHILFETEYVKQDLTREMQDSFEKVAQEAVKMVQNRSTESEEEFQKVVDEVKKQFEEVASQKLANIQKVAEDETNDFKEILRRETISSQLFIGKKIGSDFEEVQKELAEYKQQRLSEINKNINTITKQVVTEVLGQSITIPLEEQLITASLENAKKTGLFKALEESHTQIKEDAVETQNEENENKFIEQDPIKPSDPEDPKDNAQTES